MSSPTTYTVYVKESKYVVLIKKIFTKQKKASAFITKWKNKGFEVLYF